MSVLAKFVAAVRYPNCLTAATRAQESEQGKSGSGSARRWHGAARQAWLGSAWSGRAGPGLAGKAGLVSAEHGLARPGAVRQAGHGPACQGRASNGWAWRVLHGARTAYPEVRVLGARDLIPLQRNEARRATRLGPVAHQQGEP